MKQEIGALARRTAFKALQIIRQSSFKKQFEEIRAINTHGLNATEFRDQAVRELLASAQETPHYSKLDRGAGLLDFPVLEKSTIKAHPDAFLNPRYDTDELINVSTSGSYGTPLSFKLTKTKKVRQQAEVVYYGAWANYDVGTPHLYMRGQSGKSPLKLWSQNEKFASTNQLSKQWLEDQVKVLRNKRLKVIIGIPSVIVLIANEALALGLTQQDFNIEGIICSGETLREDQRVRIESAFGAKCLSRYGAEEVGTMAAECPEHQVLHVNEASFFLEVLSLTEDVPAAPGELGRIVVTDLFSHAMPLIRYDIGDLAVLGERCQCGRPTQTLKRVEGRQVEMIRDSTGELLSPFFINPIMKSVSEIEQFQFAQTGETDYTLRVVGTRSPSLDEAVRQLREKLGSQAILTVDFLDQIPALSSGKRPYVLNEWSTTGASQN